MMLVMLPHTTSSHSRVKPDILNAVHTARLVQSSQSLVQNVSVSLMSRVEFLHVVLS